MKVIRILGTALDLWPADQPRYLKSFDPEADMTKPGAEIGEFTPDIKQAMRFPDAGAAFAFWKTERKRDGPRADGKPNRPLTAFTVELEEVSE